MKPVGFFVAACLVLALGQLAATLLTLVLAVLCVWAACFHTKQVLAVLAFALFAYLLATYPGWSAALLAVVGFGCWLGRAEPRPPGPKLLPPPSEDQPRR